MKVVLTGGSGDLGTVLTPKLEARGDLPIRLDIVPPRDPRGLYVACSVLDLSETRRWLGYTPQYSLRDALRELARYGPAGPPPPYG